jgi:nucleoside-diphosphate-sugar epimerase
MDKHARIYIAGHRGLVGSALMRNLQNKGYENFVTRTHATRSLARLRNGVCVLLFLQTVIKK